MARRTRPEAPHSDLPDLNDNHANEVPKHCLGKEQMIIEADDDTNLGEFTRQTERLEDVIEAVQITVNQLNQFLIKDTGQGIP